MLSAKGLPLWGVVLVGVTVLAQPPAETPQEQAGIESLSQKYRHQERVDIAEAYIEIPDNAVNTSDVIELKVGEEPTPEQLKKANVDMVWIKEEEVAGHKIRMPVVYLAEEPEEEE